MKPRRLIGRTAYGRATAFAMVALAMSAGAANAQVFEAKIGHCTSVADTVHISNVKLQETLNKYSNGRIKTTIFPNCQLGAIPRMLEGLQLGTLEFFNAPPAFAVGTDPGYQALDAPGLFESLEHAFRAVHYPRFRDAYFKLGRDKGITVFSLWIHSATVYASTRPIRKLEDFRGLKTRVLATKVETEVMRRLGATGVPITYSEVLPALERNVVDAVRSSLSVMATSKFHSVAKYVTLVNDTYIPLAHWVGTSFLNKLPKDLQDAVFKAGDEIDDAMVPIVRKSLDDAAKDWRDNGAELISLSPGDHAEFMRRVVPVGEEVLGTNPATKELYALLKEAAAATRQTK